MRNLIILLFTSLIVTNSRAQAYEYKISSFQDKYTEIDSFTSLLLETRGDQGWDKKFELDFNFPFYDSLYNYIICDFTATCLFEHSLDYEIVLMGNGYEFDIIQIDTNNIISDVRYKLEKVNGIKALVLQYTKVRLISDTSVDEFDSHLNFQVWYYENGSMEVRFGPYNLENSPNYVPGEGFYLIPNDHPPINFGPEMLIRNSSKENEGIGLDGPYDNYMVDNIGGFLTSLPPAGWVIRFDRVTKSNAVNSYIDFINIYPNPSSGLIHIDNINDIYNIQVTNIAGVAQNFKFSQDGIDIHEIDPGIYFLKITTKSGTNLKKFVKI